MLNSTAQENYKQFAKYEKKVLIVSDKIDEQAFLIGKCIDAGIKETNIMQVNSIFEIEKLISNSLTHIIIDANLYNYFVANILEKYIDSKLISVFIFHSKNGAKTIRLITDSRLYHINSNTTPFLLQKMFDKTK